MKRIKLAVFVALMAVMFCACGKAHEPALENEAAPSSAPQADTCANGVLSAQDFERLSLIRKEEIYGQSVLIYPVLEDERYGNINGLIANRIKEAVRSVPQSVSTTFRIKCNHAGVLSMVVDLMDITTDELIARLPLTYDIASGKEVALENCFLDSTQAWRAYLPDAVTLQAGARGMVLLSDIAPIADGQFFFTTGKSLVLVYRPYEISTYAAGWPEFAIPLESLSEWFCQDGPLARLYADSALGINPEPETETEENEAPAAMEGEG